MTPLQTDIERRLAHSEPDVEVLLAEVLGGRCLRVYIDHPDGVTLAVCERVTALLSDERERYSLEVSSPGTERPLTKPAHFRRFVGRRARVKSGPLRGMIGIVLKKKNTNRFVLSLDLIMRSMSVELDGLELEPILGELPERAAAAVAGR